MAEVDRLGALEVRVAGHRPVQVALGGVDQNGSQRVQLLDAPARLRAHEHRHVRGDLVVAAAGGVQLAAEPGRRSRSPAARRPCGRPRPPGPRRTPRVSSSPATRVQRRVQRVAVGLGDDPGRREHRGVRARLGDVVGREAPVEPGRRVQRPEDRVLGLGEARHGRRVPYEPCRSRSAPPGSEDRAGPALLHESSRAYYDAFTGSDAALAADPRGDLDPARAHGELGQLPGRDPRRRGRGRSWSPSPPTRGTRSPAASCPPRCCASAPGAGRTCSRHLRASAAVMPAPVPRTLYVDALAVAAEHRRAGVATRAARRRRARGAPERGLRGVSLDTGLENSGARALYEAYGFTLRRRAARAERAHRRRRRRPGVRLVLQGAIALGQ